jgi:hypothetical protein
LTDLRPPLTSQTWFGPAVAAALTLFAVLVTLDPADCRPGMPEGPGVTIDESFNVEMGVYLVEAFKSYGIAALHPTSLREIFAEYNPDHPPLGRAWLGIFHAITQAVAPADVEGPFVTVSARVGSAFAFALTVLAVGWMTGARFGAIAGTLAATSLALMPRLFGHAHLASLETVTGLTWTLTVLATGLLWSREEGPTDRVAAGTGFLLGLALLTKIQAIILPPLVVLWALSHWRMRAVRPLAIWGLVGGVVFIAGWPWLWIDLPGHLAAYFGRTTDRLPLNVWYLGERVADRDVAWHYPWVLFLITVPPGLQLFAAAGVLRFGKEFQRRPELTLLLGSVMAPLILFSMPGVAVYDGVRLFLVSFPGWAVFAGLGGALLYEWLATELALLPKAGAGKATSKPQPEKPTAVRLADRLKLTRVRHPGIILAAVFCGQAMGLVWTHPYQLSYYNAFVGGPNGAEKLGFETTYWGDSLSRSLLLEVARRVPDGSTIDLAPTLHPFQVDVVQSQAPVMRRHNLTLRAYDSKKDDGEYLLVFHRKADMPMPSDLKVAGWKILVATHRQGTILASFYERAPTYERLEP